MNKRKYKKKHTDFYERMIFNRFIKWINLYENQVKNKRLQKYGKNTKRIYFPSISKMFINWYKNKI